MSLYSVNIFKLFYYYKNLSNLYKTNICRCISTTSCALKKKIDPGMELSEKKWQPAFNQVDPKSRQKVADITPIKVKLIKGKEYKWCSCGFSRDQPFCDDSHKHGYYKTTLLPFVFIAPETKDVWLCRCKKTNNGPFCDGSHRKDEVKELFGKLPQPIDPNHRDF